MNQLEGSLFEGFWIKCGVVVSGAFQPKCSEYVFLFGKKSVFFIQNKVTHPVVPYILDHPTSRKTVANKGLG